MDAIIALALFERYFFKLYQGILEHGKDWRIIENIVKTRTGSQVRSHAQKFFIKLNKIIKERRKLKVKDKIEFSEIEDEIHLMFKESDITDNTPS